MKILLVTDSYPPEIRSSSHLMLELAQELTRRNNEVFVITTWPSYNLDKENHTHTYKTKEIDNQVTIIRIKTLPHHKVNYIVRGIAQLIMPMQFIFYLLLYRIKTDAVIVYSPPLPLGLVGAFFKNKRVKFLLNLQDIFPANAIDLGILKNKYLVRLFHNLEKYLYRVADVVTVHSSGNKAQLLNNNPSIGGKLHVLHNWVDVNELKPLGSSNFRNEWGIDHKYLAIFAGVIGPSQNLELILQVAKAMADEKDLLFMIVGDGIEKERLQLIAIQQKITNVVFKDFVSRERYADLLSVCDLGLVCLSPLNKTPVVPGKILGYMAANIPVLAFLNEKSDGHKIIEEANCGASYDSSQLDVCINGTKKLFERIKLNGPSIGANGKRYAMKNFSLNECVNAIEEYLK